MTQAKTELEQAQETIKRLQDGLRQIHYAASDGRFEASVILQLANDLLREIAHKPLPDQWAKALSDPDEWDSMIR